jgi:hypothetical protein
VVHEGVITRNLLVLDFPASSVVVTVNSTRRAVMSARRVAVLSPLALRLAVSIESDSRNRTRWEPSARVEMTFAGRDFAPFLTRQIRCAPVPDAARHLFMEKKLRSARHRVPGARSATIWSQRACSLRAQEPVTAASTRLVPHTTRVTMRAWGNLPPDGVA